MPQDPASFPSDGELVAAALREKAAYAFLVRRWEPVLSRYVKRIVGHTESSAEDILQEVFLKAYLNLNDYDPSRPFGPWIYRITRNQTIDHLRKRKSEPAFVTGEDAFLILERLSGAGDPQDSTEWTRIEGKVRGAIAALDPRYREALVLRYLEEKGYDEISDILLMPPGTVATLIHRGSVKLRAALRILGLDVTSRGPA